VESKDETDDPDYPYDSYIDETNFNIIYENPDQPRYAIHNKYPNKIGNDDEHMWVDSDEDNASI
jgi:hypothetical protein